MNPNFCAFCSLRAMLAHSQTREVFSYVIHWHGQFSWWNFLRRILRAVPRGVFNLDIKLNRFKLCGKDFNAPMRMFANKIFRFFLPGHSRSVHKRDNPFTNYARMRIQENTFLRKFLFYFCENIHVLLPFIRPRKSGPSGSIAKQQNPRKLRDYRLTP